MFFLKDIALCLLSACLLVLSYPNFNFGFLAWIGFVPMLGMLKGRSKARVFFLSYLSGVVFWLITIHWMINVALAALIILVLYSALYFGFFGLLASFPMSREQPRAHDLLIIPCFWVLLEYIRSHIFTGFPWALLGYSQYLNLPIIQVSDITGVWGVSFLIMMVNVAVIKIMGQKKNYGLLLAVIFLWISVYGYGVYRLAALHDAQILNKIRISVIQGNIPHEMKEDLAARDYITDKYLSFTRQIIREKPDLIVWPEEALMGILENEPRSYQKTTAFVKHVRIPLLLGIATYNKDGPYNSALCIAPDGTLLKKYDKIHLVPCNEYLPADYLWFMRNLMPINDFRAGREYVVFNSRNFSFAVLICFEDLFPSLAREFVKKGAGFLINIVNDGWFKMTAAPYQHLQGAVFRAVENRVFLVRSSNTGPSGFISPAGRIISLVKDGKDKEIFTEGSITCQINTAEKRRSIYTQYGDIFILFNFASLAIYLVYVFIVEINNKE